MERVADRDLDNLRELAIRMGGLAQAILAKGLDAVWTGDSTIAEELPSDDVAIDRSFAVLGEKDRHFGANP